MIRAGTQLRSVPLVSDIRLHLAGDPVAVHGQTVTVTPLTRRPARRLARATTAVICADSSLWTSASTRGDTLSSAASNVRHHPRLSLITRSDPRRVSALQRREVGLQIPAVHGAFTPASPKAVPATQEGDSRGLWNPGHRPASRATVIHDAKSTPECAQGAVRVSHQTR